ncbi:MAG: D-aminoacyl-tRNA deacylase [Actinomycetota bacterium]
MRAVVQRASRASLRVDGSEVSSIGRGLVVLVGVTVRDLAQDAVWLAGKVVGLRVFPDDEGTMNLSLAEAGGEVLAVSQFTLLGDVRRGRRPSYVDAAPPEVAEPLYRQFVEALRGHGIPTCEGRFRAHMEVELVNDGPVTILLDSEKRF